MTETNVFQLSQPGTFADPLTEVLRNGARALLSQAVVDDSRIVGAIRIDDQSASERARELSAKVGDGMKG